MKNWDRIQVCKALKTAADEAVRYHQGITFELKSDRSLVTPADRRNEELLRNALAGEDAFFIGEETIATMGEDYVRQALTGTAWVVDPIDGTSSYAHGLPLWGISAGFMVHSILREGAIILPELNEALITEGPYVYRVSDISGSPESWEFQKIIPGEDEWNDGGLIALGQTYTKQNILPLANPIVATGSAVQALACLIDQKAIAYIGRMKLWDIAGLLPMLDRFGYQACLFSGKLVEADIRNGAFLLELSSELCWYLADSVVIAGPNVCRHLLDKLVKEQK